MMIRQLIGDPFWYPENQYSFQIINKEGMIKVFLKGRGSDYYVTAGGWAGAATEISNLIYKDNT